MKNTGRLKLLAASLPWLLAAPLLAQEGGNPPGRAARLSVIEGSVSFQPSGENDWGQATLNYTVTTGDRIYANDGARAELEMGPWAVRLAQDTDLTLANLTDQFMQLGVAQGSVRVAIYDMPPDNSVEIDTPNGALTAYGPGSYRVDVDPNDGTRVIVNRGRLQLTGGGVDRTVEAGQAVQLTGTDPIEINLLTLPGPDDFDQWCSRRDRHVESFRHRQYANPYTPGVVDLEEYGLWSETPEYGPVWYPSGVAVGWVPYRFGHWAWVEPWGWTWVEDEPWGFCPFHYGRWAFIGARWGWVPGPVAVTPWYAPALVAFVNGSGFSLSIGLGSGGVAAWFPLGPVDPFIPWYHYKGGYLRQVNITNVRNVTNITNITNVTNVTDINVTNIHYAYRDVATTAVPATVFRSGLAVAPAAVRVTAQQLAAAQVVAHPLINPARAAVFAGKPVVQSPPLRTVRVVSPPPVPSASEARPTRQTRPTPQGPAPASRPAPNIRTEPQSRTTSPEHPAPNGPPAERPLFITRTPPPTRDVPFLAHEPLLEQHPGRPLEPQQEQNLRQAQPVEPPHDQEILPHPAPAPAHQPRPAQKPPAPREVPEKR